MFFIHRIIAYLFIPNPEGKLQVNHKNCNKLDFSIDNLELVTQEENNKHAVDNKLQWTTSKFFDHNRNNNPILNSINKITQYSFIPVF